MPNLRDFERRLGGLVEGLFSKTFRSGVQPVEIAKRLVRAMDDGKQVAVNEVWAPNRFEISLSKDDAPRFQQMEPALVKELSNVVLETAGDYIDIVKLGWGTAWVTANLERGAFRTLSHTGLLPFVAAGVGRPVGLEIRIAEVVSHIRIVRSTLYRSREQCYIILPDGEIQANTYTTHQNYHPCHSSLRQRELDSLQEFCRDKNQTDAGQVKIAIVREVAAREISQRK